MSRPEKKQPNFYIRFRLLGSAHRSDTRLRFLLHMSNRPHNWWEANHDTRRVWLLWQRRQLADRPDLYATHNNRYDYSQFCSYSHKDYTVSHLSHLEVLAAIRTQTCLTGDNLWQIPGPLAVVAAGRLDKRALLWKCREMWYHKVDTLPFGPFLFDNRNKCRNSENPTFEKLMALDIYLLNSQKSDVYRFYLFIQ